SIRIHPQQLSLFGIQNHTRKSLFGSEFRWKRLRGKRLRLMSMGHFLILWKRLRLKSMGHFLIWWIKFILISHLQIWWTVVLCQRSPRIILQNMLISWRYYWPLLQKRQVLMAIQFSQRLWSRWPTKV
ncbi:hypothetical protein Dimus_027130, partial [Dionaea muscipula]